MAKKTPPSSKKRVGNRSRTRTKAPVAGKPRSGAGVNRNRAYVLIIMGLLTALVLLINKFYYKTGPDRGQELPRKADADHPRKEPVKEPVKEHDSKKEPAKKIEKTAKDLKSDSEDIPRKDTSKTIKERPVTEEIKVYFMQYNEKTEKMHLSSVGRSVDKKSLLQNTMKELIKGPTPSERKRGMLSAMPSDLKLNGARIRNKTAELDFNSAIERGASGSVLLNRIDQIVYTATQFPTVQNVVIKINGKRQESLGSDGLSIGGPLHRRQ